MNYAVHHIPVPLQYQILTRTALAAISLFLAALSPFFITGTAAIPFLLGALLLAANAGHIYWATASERVLELKGVVLKLEQTAFRRRPKALFLEIDGKALRVVLHSRRSRLKPGDQVTLFILDSAQLYPWHGLHQLDSYLALAADTSAARA